ncbi:MAG: HK97-gp10 family putative phage morphogenesis protein [Candidatus Paceibacterota bacterium]
MSSSSGVSNYFNKCYQSNIPKVKYVLTEIEKACLKEIGRYVRDEARERVPVKTGKLKKNISYQIRRKDKSVRLGVKRKAFYGLFVEKGHKILPKGFHMNQRTGKMVQAGHLSLQDTSVGIRKDGTTYTRRAWKSAISMEFGGKNVPAKPFLTPAVKENINHIRLIAGKYFKEIEKENIDIGLIGPDDGERDDS